MTDTLAASDAAGPVGRADHPGDSPAAVLAPRWTRYVALGDSFTEGLEDADPVTGRYRGWADLLAGHLQARRLAAGMTERLRYANLSVRGHLLRSVMRVQLPRALDLGADLVSFVGGGNDILRPRVDPDDLATRIEGAVGQLRSRGVDVLLATGPDIGDGQWLHYTRGRSALFNSHIWSIARRHGAYVLDLWGMRSLRDARMWAPDRIHLSTQGHRRVAQAALVALGVAPDDAGWDDPLTPLPPLPAAQRARQDAVWIYRYAMPWVHRRLTGRSSGDGRTAKIPDLVDPLA